LRRGPIPRYHLYLSRRQPLTTTNPEERMRVLIAPTSITQTIRVTLAL